MEGKVIVNNLSNLSSSSSSEITNVIDVSVTSSSSMNVVLSPLQNAPAIVLEEDQGIGSLKKKGFRKRKNKLHNSGGDGNYIPPYKLRKLRRQVSSSHHAKSSNNMKFLLGGNASDPLNLNGLSPSESSITPTSSPLINPTIPILIPTNYADPLCLRLDLEDLENTTDVIAGVLDTVPLPLNKRKRHRRRSLRKRTDSECSVDTLGSGGEEEEQSGEGRGQEDQSGDRRDEEADQSEKRMAKEVGQSERRSSKEAVQLERRMSKEVGQSEKRMKEAGQLERRSSKEVSQSEKRNSKEAAQSESRSSKEVGQSERRKSKEAEELEKRRSLEEVDQSEEGNKDESQSEKRRSLNESQSEKRKKEEGVSGRKKEREGQLEENVTKLKQSLKDSEFKESVESSSENLGRAADKDKKEKRTEIDNKEDPTKCSYENTCEVDGKVVNADDERSKTKGERVEFYNPSPFVYDSSYDNFTVLPFESPSLTNYTGYAPSSEPFSPPGPESSLHLIRDRNRSYPSHIFPPSFRILPYHSGRGGKEDPIVSPVFPNFVPKSKNQQHPLSLHPHLQQQKQGSKTPKFREKDKRFSWGNYCQYYGYRRSNELGDEDGRVRAFRREWIEGKDVLDIGCNIGHITLTIARDFGPRRIVGVDIDPYLVRVAEKNIRHYVERDPNDLSIKFPSSLSLVHGGLQPPELEAVSLTPPHHSTTINQPIGGEKNSPSSSQQPIGGEKNSPSSSQQPIGGEKNSPSSSQQPIGGEKNSSSFSNEPIGGERSKIPCLNEQIGGEGSSSSSSSSTTRRKIPFPYNVSFRQENYVLESDECLKNVSNEWDVILCLSTTKWVHLNFGDDGLKRFFKRAFLNLRPGGIFILEPQPWSSYRKKKKLTEHIYRTFQTIKFQPPEFEKYLLSHEIGFRESKLIGIPAHHSKGFQRPVYVFTK